ncbi:MAG: class I SAM-dependent methyltransferase [Halobacteriaceae archaeon]
MRRFSAEYLAYAREGLWEGERAALEPLALPDQDAVLDAGAGSGEFTRVLREEAGPDATVLAADADRDLLADAPPPRLAADATRLPLRDGAVDLVACQALLVNLPDPAAAVEAFARVASDRVACVEPDNAAVAVRSTVDVEAPLARRVREAYLSGVETDVALGDASDLFRAAGLVDVETREVHHTRVTEPPYGAAAVEAARRKARGDRIDAVAETLAAGGLSGEELSAVAADWRAMGRTAVEQMAAERYRRAEVVPYHVTVGRVP